MVNCRPGPFATGLGAFMLLASLFVPATDAAADTALATGGSAIPYGSPDTLGGDSEGLAEFTKKHTLGRIVPTADIVSGNEPAMSIKLRALNLQDRAAAYTGDGLQEETVETLKAAPEGFIDLDMLDPGAIDAIKIGDETEEWACLAEAIYFEARGESLEGQVAVAEVILNRADSRKYPDTVCEVIRQGAKTDSGGGCQFSYNCDGKSNEIAETSAYDRIGKIAWMMLDGRPRKLTDEALFYHADYVSPSWASAFIRTAVIGQHIFYKPEMQLSQR